MSETRFCPHCGELIPADPEQKYCMFCGEELSPYTLQVSAEAEESEPVYKPYWWQTTAALFMFALTIFTSILLEFLPEIYYYNPDFGRNIGLSRFIPLITAGVIAMLLGGVKNRATKIALIIWIVGDLVTTVFQFLPSMSSESSWAWLSYVIAAISQFIIPLSTVYALSLIAQNNSFSTSTRTWLNILAVISSFSLIWTTQFYWLPSNVFDFDIWPFYYVAHFELVVMQAFNACAWWVLARSEVFGGSYEEEAMCDYSPLNKYMAMALVTPAIFIPLALVILEYI